MGNPARHVHEEVIVQRKLATWKWVVIAAGMCVAALIACVYRLITTGSFFIKK
ncbi:MAG: hypothetical protein Q8Q13_02335 [bacterium]|nr:hypothetical protein [bacterium]